MSTKLIRSLYNISAAQQGSVLSIGHFDGVHVGHQQLITEVRKQAAIEQAPAMVLTFEPHAFEYFSQGTVTIPRLTRLREKFCALSQYGIENVLVLPFNQHLAALSASDFVTKILHEQLQVRRVIVGDDFQFGHKRSGNINLLKEMGDALGFAVDILPTVTTAGERVSSTRVRQALSEGDLALAERLLGRPYQMLGRVSHGDKLGRELGFRTANIFLHRRLTPVKGIFTVYVHGIGDRPLPGVANVGTRPAVGGTRTLLEVHLLDFNQEIYGRYVGVTFCKKLRDEAWYPTLDLLKAQIAKDVAMARDFFKENENDRL
ncbi:MAG TPA: bifunctional riboflavin kinase/FAD synthetase [Gammaproteobacteria bacterium]|jgi:riboflavin kinase/FMN adenylyltransferase|nr:bifunctional riboflavin kinase/FAD synthetase [Gammaproteobacteria bacterium]